MQKARASSYGFTLIVEALANGGMCYRHWGRERSAQATRCSRLRISTNKRDNALPQWPLSKGLAHSLSSVQQEPSRLRTRVRFCGFPAARSIRRNNTFFLYGSERSAFAAGRLQRDHQDLSRRLGNLFLVQAIRVRSGPMVASILRRDIDDGGVTSFGMFGWLEDPVDLP